MNLRHHLSSRHKLFLFVFLAIIIAVAYFLVLNRKFEAIILSSIILGVLLVAQKIWLPKNYGDTKVKLYSLQITFLTCIAYLGWKEEILRFILGNVPDQNSYTDLLTYSPLLAVVLVVYIVNRSTNQKVLRNDLPAIDTEFPVWDFVKDRNAFCKILRNQLQRIDLETNWSASYFTPLEAEVEINTQFSRKKAKSLLRAIRRDKKSTVFLVLGDPGSGKSVALRKLAQDLLEEVNDSPKSQVPIYLNLKEWKATRKWTEENPPTTKELLDFTLNSLKGIDIFADEFLDRYFLPMFKNGYFFFIFDSFDEIPGILDHDERSWLVDKLSEVLYDFISGAHLSRGILSSRQYRKPTIKFQRDKALIIRPFSEYQIRETFLKTLGNEQFIKAVIKDVHLLNISKNPFTASLLSIYIKKNRKLPDNKASIYEYYIMDRIESSAKKLIEFDLYPEKVIDHAIRIAHSMFIKDDMGLEAHISDLAKEIDSPDLESVIQFLKYIRIGRLGAGRDPSFSFSHRRFNEYFIVQHLIRNQDEVPKESIPTDSRWRDSLVLFVEVADAEVAKNIGDYCWRNIKYIVDENLKLGDEKYLMAVHSLRFLVEGFRARKELLSHLENEIHKFVLEQIKSGKTTLLEKKLAVEAVGLLQIGKIEPILIHALELGNSWINETVILACRYLDELTNEISKKVYEIISSIKVYLKKEINQFRLIDSFSLVSKWLIYRQVESIVTLIFSTASVVCLIAYIWMFKIRYIIDIEVFILSLILIVVPLFYLIWGFTIVLRLFTSLVIYGAKELFVSIYRETKRMIFANFLTFINSFQEMIRSLITLKLKDLFIIVTALISMGFWFGLFPILIYLTLDQVNSPLVIIAFVTQVFSIGLINSIVNFNKRKNIRNNLKNVKKIDRNQFYNKIRMMDPIDENCYIKEILEKDILLYGTLEPLKVNTNNEYDEIIDVKMAFTEMPLILSNLNSKDYIDENRETFIAKIEEKSLGLNK